MAEVDFNYWLGRKYAQLQQQADATTQNAATSALTGRAAATLDTVRANLLPAESRANIAQSTAAANLTNEQAKIVAPESAARIAQTRAETGYTTTQDAVLRRQGLTPIGQLLGNSRGALTGILGPQGYQGYKLGDIVPPEPPINSPDRVRWLDAQQPPWP